MKDLRRLLLWSRVCTFLGGLGLGAWVGTLAAATPEKSRPIDRRIRDFQQSFTLNPSQVRQLRALLHEHDAGRESIMDEVSVEQWKRIRQLEQRSRKRLRSEVLTEEQRMEWDKLFNAR